jgi:hypothetical protein
MEHFRRPPVLMMLLEMRFRKFGKVTALLRFENGMLKVAAAKPCSSHSKLAT